MNKQRMLVLGTVTALILLGGLFWWNSETRTARSLSPSEPRSGNSTDPVGAGSVRTTAGPKTKSPNQTGTARLPSSPQSQTEATDVPSSATAISGESPASLNRVRITSDQVVATVNGAPILLKDLVSLEPGETEKTFPKDDLEGRLQRAIENALILQAAAAQGIQLNEAQLKNLEQVKARATKALENLKYEGVHRSSVTAAQLEFEQRLLQARFLQETLLQQAGVGVPYGVITDAVIEQYYRQHTETYGSLPTEEQAAREKWAEISKQIRKTLTTELFQDYTLKRDQHMQQLKANATIQISVPES